MWLCIPWPSFCGNRDHNYKTIILLKKGLYTKDIRFFFLTKLSLFRKKSLFIVVFIAEVHKCVFGSAKEFWKDNFNDFFIHSTLIFRNKRFVLFHLVLQHPGRKINWHKKWKKTLLYSRIWHFIKHKSLYFEEFIWLRKVTPKDAQYSFCLLNPTIFL